MRSKRQQVLGMMSCAGYHGDRRALLRLYVENRISLAVANRAWEGGQQARKNGMKCGCAECQKEKQ